MKQKKHRSFSLIEILTVLTLFFIFFSFVIPKQTIFTNLLLHNEIENLFTIFSLLQHKAIATNCKQKIHLFAEKNSYTYRTKTKKFIHKLPKQIIFGYLQNSKGPPSSPKTIIKKAITFKSDGTNTKCLGIKVKKLTHSSQSSKAISDSGQNNKFCKKKEKNIYTVIFFPNGKITPGTIYLIDKKQNLMEALTCPISQVSYIRKYHYKNNRWILL